MFFEFFGFLSLVFEIFTLFLALFLKNNRIFFLSLALLLFHLPYFYTSIFQAHLFVSLFLPLIFTLFSVKKVKNLLKENLSFFAMLFLTLVLSIILPNNTSFNSANLNFNFLSFLKPLNELGFVFFVCFGFILLLKCFKNREFYLLLAYLGANFQFLFESLWTFSYIEFASLMLFFELIYKKFKDLFFDELTKLPNEKYLSHYTKAKKQYFLALLHFSELKDTKEVYKKLILKQISKLLRRFKARIFIVENDFILVFNDKNETLNHLAFLESTLKNTDFKLENEIFKPEFQLVFMQNKESLRQDLKSLRDKLLG